MVPTKDGIGKYSGRLVDRKSIIKIKKIELETSV